MHQLLKLHSLSVTLTFFSAKKAWLQDPIKKTEQKFLLQSKYVLVYAKAHPLFLVIVLSNRSA